MDFFTQQDQARRQSRWLVALFVLAVASIALAIGALAYLLAGWSLVPYAAGGVLALIVLASAFKTMALRQGGGKVARAMQGTLVDPNTKDPLRRRLHHVVEEIAIASGVPVPEVYVLEQEPGINAFAAGYTPNDAAVAVTRGLLERLNRDELQGVIAHEFSHILNGDMRINIRLIGVLFGVMVLALMGQHMMHSARFSKNSKDAAPLMMISLVVVLVGYIGLFFGRLIKAAVSRQREYLADAAAVQFTRNPAGIAGALKKIAVLSEGSALRSDGEEVSHMLFGQGHAATLLATHPPLIKRIQAIEPGFDEDQLQAIGQEVSRRERVQAETTQKDTSSSGSGGILGGAGSEDWFQWLAASAFLLELPDPIKAQAHDDEQIEAFVIYLLVCDQWLDNNGLAGLVETQLGAQTLEEVQALAEQWGVIPRPWRLPLLEMAIPNLRRRPQADLLVLQGLVGELILADGKLDVFEYAMDRLLGQSIESIIEPSKQQMVGGKNWSAHSGEIERLLAVIALQGHGGQEQQQVAWKASMEKWFQSSAHWPVVKDWPAQLDAAVDKLNALNAASKTKLVGAMVECIGFDGKVSDEEYALCRVLAALLHVPLPLSLE